MNVQFDALAKKHGKAEATEIMNEIRDLGGFGNNNGIGGLDLTGLLAESNDAIGNKQKARIAELAGVDRKDLEKRIEAGRKELARGEKSKNNIIPPDVGVEIGRN
jgi:hypothetical protein